MKKQRIEKITVRVTPEVNKAIKLCCELWPQDYPSESQVIRSGVMKLYREKLKDIIKKESP